MNKQAKLYKNTLTQKNKIITASIILLFTLVMLLPGTTTAQDVVSFTAAIRIPHPQGGFVDDKIISFEYAEQSLGSSRGRAASSVEMADIIVTRYVDDFSPWLFLDCADGSHISEVSIYVYPGDVDPEQVTPQGAYLEIRLRDVTVSSYSLMGESDGDAPKEVFTLRYVQIFYRVDQVDKEWDLAQNKQI